MCSQGINFGQNWYLVGFLCLVFFVRNLEILVKPLHLVSKLTGRVSHLEKIGSSALLEPFFLMRVENNCRFKSTFVSLYFDY